MKKRIRTRVPCEVELTIELSASVSPRVIHANVEKQSVHGEYLEELTSQVFDSSVFRINTLEELLDGAHIHIIEYEGTDPICGNMKPGDILPQHAFVHEVFFTSSPTGCAECKTELREMLKEARLLRRESP